MTPPVVFDCDGVLVDSESLAWMALGDALGPFGVVVTDADRKALAGRTFTDDYNHFAARVALPPESELFEAVVAATVALFERHLEAFEDAVDTLDRLVARGTRLAVASSSARARLDVSLRSTGLDGYFAVSIAGDEVANGKPAPDLFLAAAESLGERPEDCTAVEDSPAGIASAKAAGMYVVAVDRGEWDAADLAGADVVVPRLTPALFLDR
ncbi:MAG: HAD family phosphatase [Acidimicrobiia bacterium]|nr:HAD family phosphatase [Acidimicrobiia bacterium]